MDVSLLRVGMSVCTLPPVGVSVFLECPVPPRDSWLVLCICVCVCLTFPTLWSISPCTDLGGPWDYRKSGNAPGTSVLGQARPPWTPAQR